MSFHLQFGPLGSGWSIARGGFMDRGSSQSERAMSSKGVRQGFCIACSVSVSTPTEPDDGAEYLGDGCIIDRPHASDVRQAANQSSPYARRISSTQDPQAASKTDEPSPFRPVAGNPDWLHRLTVRNVVCQAFPSFQWL